MKLLIQNIHLYMYVHMYMVDLTAAILQKPFFDANRPSYANYAKIGQSIGHEITHGFDGIDANEKYQSRSKCFEEQFSAYESAAGDKVSNYLYGSYKHITYIIFR